MKWKPIESAPKDGSWVLIYERQQLGHSDENIFLAQWKEGSWWVCNCTDISDELVTHWANKPKGPKKK